MHVKVCAFCCLAIGAAQLLPLAQLQQDALAQTPGLHDDRAIMIDSEKKLHEKRQQLIAFIWGAKGWPTQGMPIVEKNDSSPVTSLQQLKRVDTLTIEMEQGQKSYAHHFIPKRSNHRLVILHHGHAPTFNDDAALADRGYGMHRSIDQLLIEGYSVLAVYMPHIVQFQTKFKVDDRGSISHDQMFSQIKVKQGSVLKFFLEPVAVCLNYLTKRAAADDFPTYQEFNMMGLSGGGWTTTVYAALDPRIKHSFPVAGSIPLYLRTGGSVGDTEQTLNAFYRLAGYPDLYLMGSHGQGRVQVQILNRRDDCCFGERQHQGKLKYDDALRQYEQALRQQLLRLGGSGRFRLEIDEAAPGHMISWQAVHWLLDELNGSRPSVGGCRKEHLFVRGMSGDLWHWRQDEWQNTRLPIMGMPAVVQGDVHELDLFGRQPDGGLLHAWFEQGQWRSERCAGTIISDPQAVATQAGTIVVLALGANYQPYQWTYTAKGMSSFQSITAGQPVWGRFALVHEGQGKLSLFSRGFDRTLNHLQFDPALQKWTWQSMQGALIDSPTAQVDDKGALHVFVRGPGHEIWEVTSKPSQQGWQWHSITQQTKGKVLTSAPMVHLVDKRMTIWGRSESGTLACFTFEGQWEYQDTKRQCTSQPTPIGQAVLFKDQTQGLMLYDGQKCQPLGGVFD